MNGSQTEQDRYNTIVPTLVVIGGPTATGKSSLAIALAKRLHSGILSADSRQVYREFNIGTAKPSLAEQQLVPHYLIDCCEPTATLTVAEYQAQAQALIAAFHHGKPVAGAVGWCDDAPEFDSACPLLVGGTGLYIRAVTQGLKIPRVAPQPDLRSHLEALGQTHCYQMLQQVDPVAATKIHPNDAVRTLRALEVFYVTGCPISTQQGENPPTYPILQIGLDCPDTEALRRRIERRTGQMLELGFVAEVEELCQKYGPDLPLLQTLGYVEFKQALLGDRTLTSAFDETVVHTRQFAKRQRTWFRANPAMEWFDADAVDLVDQVWSRVQEFLRATQLEGAIAAN